MRCENCGHGFPSHIEECPKCKRPVKKADLQTSRTDESGDVGFAVLGTTAHTHDNSCHTSSSYGSDSSSSDCGGSDGGGGGGGD